VTWGAQKQLPTSSHFVVILCRTPKEMLPESDHVLYIRKEIKDLPEDILSLYTKLHHKFLESDFALLGNERAMFEWACRQTYIALGNMMTAAAQIGIDSCPVEGFDKEKAEQVLREAGVLKDDRFGISCMVAFGYRIREPREKTRQPADQVVEWVR
jgi:nitroreductase